MHGTGFALSAVKARSLFFKYHFPAYLAFWLCHCIVATCATVHQCAAPLPLMDQGRVTECRKKKTGSRSSRDAGKDMFRMAWRKGIFQLEMLPFLSRNKAVHPAAGLPDQRLASKAFIFNWVLRVLHTEATCEPGGRKASLSCKRHLTTMSSMPEAIMDRQHTCHKSGISKPTEASSKSPE